MFRRSLKTSYINLYMPICILVITVVMLLGVYGENIHNQKICDVLYYYELTCGVGHVQLLLPIVSGIPFVLGFYTESKSGYQSFCLTRCNKGRYVLTKGVCAFLSGFGVVFVGAVLFVVTIIMLGMGNEIVFTEQMMVGVPDQATFWNNLTEAGYGWLDLTIRVVLFGCIGGIWSVVCFVACVFPINKYLVLAVPCLVQIVSTYLLSLSFLPKTLQMLNPGNLTLKAKIQDNWDGGISYVLVYSLVVLALGIGGYRVGLERRRHYG